MKVTLTFKDPDGVYESVRDAVQDTMPAGLSEDEENDLLESRTESTFDALKKWIKWKEYVTVEKNPGPNSASKRRATDSICSSLRKSIAAARAESAPSIGDVNPSSPRAICAFGLRFSSRKSMPSALFDSTPSRICTSNTPDTFSRNHLPSAPACPSPVTHASSHAQATLVP